MKRLMLSTATLAVAAVSLTACGGSSGGSSSTSSSGGQATSTGSQGAGAAASLSPQNPSSAVSVNEDGSSLLYPYVQEIAGPLHQKYSNVTLNAAAGGSGKGISDATNGTVDMGGSDAYLPATVLSTNPGLMNIPIVVSGQAVEYNLNGVKNLKLSGAVVAKMYQGKITKWNDPAITKLNPGATLPSTKIVPVRRVDSSGDTFLFTSFLSATSSAWSNGPGAGTTVTWPSAGGELTANGNPGMVQTCQQTPGCVAYVGVSALSEANQAGLGEAMLQNKAGQFLQPTQATLTAAASAGAGSVPANLAQSLIYQAGAQSYPITNFEYIVVKAQQPSAAKAQALQDFFAFAMDPTGGGQSQYLQKEDFVALPSSVVPKAQAAAAKIHG